MVTMSVPSQTLLFPHGNDTMVVISFLLPMSGAKFEEHCFNIAKDIVYSVFYHFSCKPHDVITFIICKVKKRQYL